MEIIIQQERRVSVKAWKWPWKHAVVLNNGSLTSIDLCVWFEIYSCCKAMEHHETKRHDLDAAVLWLDQKPKQRRVCV